MNEEVDVCPICALSCASLPCATLTEKGCTGINEASRERKDSIEVKAGQQVHTECRKKYTNVNVIKGVKTQQKRQHEDTSQPDRNLRSQEQRFEFATCCLFCGSKVNLAAKHGPDKALQVRTFSFQNSLFSMCDTRKDTWSNTVRGRLEFARDLHAADAVYHKACDINFRTKRQIPSRFQLSCLSSTAAKKPYLGGRPKDENKAEAFEQTIEYLRDNDDEQVTVGDLLEKMKEFSGGTAYTQHYLKEKLLAKFGDKIIVTEINGKPNVVTFRTTAKVLLHDFYSTPKGTDEEAEKIRLVQAAAALIKNDIKTSTTSVPHYPSSEDIASEERNLDFVPKSLLVFLRSIFSEKDADIKMASIGQAIVQAARPRVVIAPLQIGLGIQMHHHFGSRFLIDTLNAMGFSSSYSEVKKFEANAATFQSTDIPGCSGQVDTFLQYVADNVDHNSCTLDGHNTFHGMGIIATTTPGAKRTTSIPRFGVTLDEVKEKAHIDIIYYHSKKKGFADMKFSQVEKQRALDLSEHVDTLWKVSWPLRPARPSWSGMMQTVHKDKHPGKSSVIFLPMIDMNPSDMTCIHSTLLFVAKEAHRHQSAPVLTFDQPLYWKAQEIVANIPDDSELKSIVLRLGAFHTEMSFLGCIGRLMEGSGLQDVLELSYAPNAVVHMLQGKAVARAIRGHFLVDSALNALLVAQTFGITLPTPSVHFTPDNITVEETQPHDVPPDVQAAIVFEDIMPPTSLACEDPEKSIDEDLSKGLQLYDQLLDGRITVHDVGRNEAVVSISLRLNEKKTLLRRFPTAALWLQYMQLIDILRRFIKAERTGNWELHLSSVQEMMPYLAAAGHNLYTKSLQVYLQQMLQLHISHPEVHRRFKDGGHVMRRTDRFWAGLSSDLVIEQVLMRSLKTTGGLTRGRGLTESQRAQWLLAMPACADISGALQEFAGSSYIVSEQHKDMSVTRRKQDEKDTRLMVCFLEERDPFSQCPDLKNIATGVVAPSSTNVHRADDVGERVLKKMVGQSITEFGFKRSDQAVKMTMASRNAVKIDEDVVSVDPQLLFQRLVSAVGNLYENKNEVFKFELSSYPSSLFESPTFPLPANKSQLADEIWNTVHTNMPELPSSGDIQYILDGGALVQKIPWSRGSTFASIIQSYVRYVTQKFQRPVVVFDGYLSGPSTKDVTHLRRSKGMTSTEVLFKPDMMLQTRKDQFLSNKKNKQRFIDFLCQALTKNSCTTVCSEGDADSMIVAHALDSSKHQVTVVVGDDTDLLVLLCYHAKVDDHDIFLQPSHRATAKTVRCWNIKHTKRSLDDLCHILPVIHAISGCDTTSRPFGVGKRTALRKFQKSQKLKNLATLFVSDSKQDDIIQAGEKMLLTLYDGSAEDSLDNFRYKVFCSKVAAGTTFLQVHSLPPTSAAAKYHSLRVYLQVQDWLGNDRLHPHDWGWKTVNHYLVPCTTDLPPAPSKLLSVIRCNCKSDCESQRCSCRKHGLDCSPACGECHGLQCSNAASMCIDNETEDC